MALGRTSRWSALAPSNRRVALEVLLHGPLARTEIADRLGLSTPSLTRITKPLLDSGILREVAPSRSAERDGGRPREPLEVNADLDRFVGIKLAGYRAYGVLTNLRADILATCTRDIANQGVAAVLRVLAEVTAELSATGSAPAAIGVAVGGAVRNSSFIVRAPFLHWENIDLGELLREVTAQPVVVANDLDALMEAEHWFGDGRDVANFATLTIGAGVGGGLVVHDRLVTGRESGLGLLGHFPIDPLGPACREGHRGCADALLTTEGIQGQAALAYGRPLKYDEILDRAVAGDSIADNIVGRAAYGLGTLIAAVANIAQPERILLTGEGIRLAQVGAVRLQAGVRQARVPEASDLDIRIIDDDPTLWARGAAAVAIQSTVLDQLEPGARN